MKKYLQIFDFSIFYKKTLKIINKILLIIFLVISSLILQAQTNLRFESITKLADKQFRLEYYYNAISFYEKALALNDNDVHVNYQLGECYRKLFKYQDAESYYKKAAELDIIEKPLSLFYLALMQKLRGEYEEAIVNYEDFIDKTKDIPPERFSYKRAYFQRALIEMEGCYWSLEQLFEYNCDLLPVPVNTEFNDYAASMFDENKIIVITTDREKSKSERFTS